MSCWPNMRIVLSICGLAAMGALMASDAYPPPRFTDPQRVKKLEAAMPEVDRILRSYAEDKKIPGMVWGVVIDGQTRAHRHLRRAGQGVQCSGHAENGVSHRVHDQELHGVGDSEAAR